MSALSPDKSINRRKKDIEQFVGEGAKGLGKLNEMLDLRKMQQNQFKKLFTYIETIETYKK